MVGVSIFFASVTSQNVQYGFTEDFIAGVSSFNTNTEKRIVCAGYKRIQEGILTSYKTERKKGREGERYTVLIFM